MTRKLPFLIALPFAIFGGACGAGADSGELEDGPHQGQSAQALRELSVRRDGAADAPKESWPRDVNTASESANDKPISGQDNPYDDPLNENCGDQQLQTGEECDPPGLLWSSDCPNTKKSCSGSCQCMAFCGNAVHEPGELCDFAADPQCALDCQSFQQKPPYGGGWTDPVTPPEG